ncbi:MAG: 2-polyprenyl-3-methyl-6-methoxy-1,4-benzoquinone monooxygenase [Woeseiaceae bacterium]
MKKTLQSMRQPSVSPLDRLVASADNALRTLLVRQPQAARDNPAVSKAQSLGDSERRLSGGLMRINHAGEVAAQALYQGHALVARSDRLHQQLQHAAEEEFDHLAWCRARLDELGEAPSLLNPAWYAGAYAIGAASGLVGDQWGLGFIDETERQVAEHLEGHIQKLPADDQRSREILRTMKEEEEAHGQNARDAGAASLPAPIKGVMRAAAAIMKAGAYRI